MKTVNVIMISKKKHMSINKEKVREIQDVYIVKPKLDVMFKKLFASEENKELLMSLISSLLSIDVKLIKSIEVLNGEILPDEKGEKFGRLDLLLIMNDETKINIELQIKIQDDYADRSTFYWSKAYTTGLKAGEEYSELKETICINIIGFKMFDCEEYHSHFQIMEKDRHEVLTEKFAIHFFELPKLRGTEVNADDMMKLWLKLIDCESEEELEMLERTNAAPIKEAAYFIRRMSADEKVKERARLEEKRLHDEASIIGTARRQGIKEGRNEERIEMICRMIKGGFDEPVISGLGYTKDEYNTAYRRLREPLS